MPSPVSIAPAGNTTPGRRNPKPTRTRTTQRRVYGKRKADAPRAVFEQGSPAKPLEKAAEKTLQNAVDCVQAKLAEITIDETPTTQKVEEAVESPSDPVDETNNTQDAPTPTPIPEPKNESPSEASPKTKPTAKKQYETMVEVRVSAKAPAQEPSKEKKDSENTTVSEKRTTRKAKPAPRLSSGCVMDEKANTYVRPILDEALSPVAAQSIQKFNSWAARAGNLLEVVKIAEGSYGEVYKLRLREEVCKKEMSKSKLARLKAYGDGVFKVVPLRAKSGPGSKKFTSIDEIVSEVKMLKYLDPIPGFARFREIHVVQGRFPESFQSAWDHYKKTKDDCMNPNPSNKRAYPDSQLWAIVEMDDAGYELEKFSWCSTFQIYDIFWGVAMALARAEEYALFEHRDLHLGNVCIRTTRRDGRMDPPTELEILRQPDSSGFGLSTLETTIIDYSLSRAELAAIDGSSGNLHIASSDLDKKQIFDAIGRDDDEILLRDTYRYMRAQLYQSSPLLSEKPPDIPGIWAEYAPRTNLVWLLFLLKSLLNNRKAEPSQAEPSPPPRQPLAPRSLNKEVKPIAKSDKKDNKLAPVQITKETQTKVSHLKKTLEDRLNSVLELLNFDHGHEDMCCAADLVAYAIDSQWLAERDFF